MARRSKQSMLKRQREAKKAEKAAAKREKRAARRRSDSGDLPVDAPEGEETPATDEERGLQHAP